MPIRKTIVDIGCFHFVSLFVSRALENCAKIVPHSPSFQNLRLGSPLQSK